MHTFCALRMSSHRKKQRQRRIRRRHRQRRHQRLREVHRQSIHAHLIFLLFLALMELCIGGVWSLFGGPRGELCHTRKELEKDIFPAYGDSHFRQAYRMEKESFYILHAVLQPHLNRYFFPKQGGRRCPRTNPYLIRTEVRLL